MARKKKSIPEYGTVMLRGEQVYRTRIEDADGKRVSLYAKTREELYDRVQEAKRQIEEAKFRRLTPTVEEYCERWLEMQSAHIRVNTLQDYRSKVKNYIIVPLGHKYMAEVTPDDVNLAIISAYDKQIGSKDISPFADMLPLIEGVNPDDHDAAIQQLLSKIGI